MGEGHHGVEAEHAGAALDGVGGAEGGVELLGVVGRVLQHQQGLLVQAQHLLRFGQESGTRCGEDLGVVVGHGSPSSSDCRP